MIPPERRRSDGMARIARPHLVGEQRSVHPEATAPQPDHPRLPEAAAPPRVPQLHPQPAGPHPRPPADPQQQPLALRLPPGDPLAPACRGLLPLDRFEVAAEVSHVLPPQVPAKRVGAVAEAQVPALSPHREVVPAGMPGSGGVGDLVADQARRGARPVGLLPAVRLPVLIRRRIPRPHPSPQHGPRLDRQGVGGEMVRLARQGARQGGRPGGGGLRRRSHDEVQAHRPEAGPAGGLHRPYRVVAVMAPTQVGEDPAVEGLAAQRHAVEPGPGQPVRLRPGPVLRVGLQAHLGPGAETETGLQPLQDPLQPPGRHPRRGPAPEVDRLQRPPPGDRLDLGHQRPAVAFRQVVPAGRHREVAVRTHLFAERDVHVHRPPPAGAVRQAGVVRRGDPPGGRFQSLTRSAATNASEGTSTDPTIFIRLLPSFWRARSFLLRVTSPP